MKARVTRFYSQPDSSIATTWVFTSMKVQLERDVLSSLCFLLLCLFLSVSRESSICCQLSSSALFHRFPAASLTLYSVSAGAYGCLGCHFKLLPVSVQWDPYVSLSTYAHHGLDAMTTSG